VTYIPYTEFLKSTLKSNRLIKSTNNKLYSRVQNMIRIKPSKRKEVLKITEESGQTKIDKDVAKQIMKIKGNTFTLSMGTIEQILSNSVEGSMFKDVVNVFDENGKIIFLEDVDISTSDNYTGEFITDENGNLIITKKLELQSKTKPVIIEIVENKNVEKTKKECVSTDVKSSEITIDNEVKDKKKLLIKKRPKIGDTI
jgi:hypothetical protein